MNDARNNSVIKNSILVVDDEGTNIIVLTNILSQEYTVYAASDGQDGIEVAQEQLPDLILLDILMPDMDGYEVLSKLKSMEETKDIPVIFITGLTKAGSEEKGLALGAADYIAKPFSTAVVKSRVENQIKIVNNTRALDKRLKQQALMTKISQIFLSGANIESQHGEYSDTLRMLGEFMDVAQVLLFRLEGDEQSVICKSEWTKPGLKMETRMGEEMKLDNKLLSVIKDLPLNKEGDLCLHSNNPAYKEAMKQYRKNFSNFITAPVYIKGKVCAAIDFSREDEDREWSRSEIDLAVMAAGIFSGLFERDEIERQFYSSRAKSEVLSRMSHEMRTPLNLIMGVTQIAMLQDLPDDINDFFEKITGASKELLSLIEDALNVSGKLPEPSFNSGVMYKVEADFSGKTILVVDYMETNRFLVRQILNSIGVNIIEADNGKEAVDIFLAEPEKIDLILTDISMPVMNGYEAARKIRASGLPNAGSVPIIALTALTDKEDIDAATNAGMNHHLAKPVEPKTLLAALKKFIGVKGRS